MKIGDAVVTDVLGRAMVARIATVSKNGRPHVNPLYFVVVGGHVHLGTATYTLAAHNVGANPFAQILFEVESDPADTRTVRIDGSVVIRTDPDSLRRYRRRVARKYVITPGGLWNMLTHPRQWRPMRRHLRGGAACVLDVSPTRIDVLAGPADRRPGADPF